MAVTVHECEPDVYIECDGCDKDIAMGGKMFCATCANKKQDETEPCRGCNRATAITELFSKIGKGKLCHACAFRYEYRLLMSERRKERKKRLSDVQGKPKPEPAPPQEPKPTPDDANPGGQPGGGH